MCKIAIINKYTKEKLWVSNWKDNSNNEIKKAFECQSNEIYALVEITKDNTMKIIS